MIQYTVVLEREEKSHPNICISEKYPKPKPWKTFVYACMLMQWILMTSDTFSMAVVISLYKMYDIHLKLEQSAIAVTVGTLQRRDSLYDILNYSSQMNRLLFLLVSMPRSNAAWQLASSDLHRNQIMTTGVSLALWKITPTSCHVCTHLECTNWRWHFRGFT